MVAKTLKEQKKHVMDLSGGWSVYEITNKDILEKEISKMKYDAFWDEYRNKDSNERIYVIYDANGVPCVPLRTGVSSHGNKEFIHAGGYRNMKQIPQEYLHAVQEFIFLKNLLFSYNDEFALQYTGCVCIDGKYYGSHYNLPENSKQSKEMSFKRGSKNARKLLSKMKQGFLRVVNSLLR